MKEWAWTALNEATGHQFGRFRTEQEAQAEANRRTRKTRNQHTARQATIRRGERVVAEVACTRCGARWPDADGLVLGPKEDVLLCGACSVGERVVSLHPVILASSRS